METEMSKSEFPTPWRIPKGTPFCPIEAANGANLLYLDTAERIRMEPNALALAVHRVNAHDALVAALEEIHKWADSGAMNPEALRSVIRTKARSALALATH